MENKSGFEETGMRHLTHVFQLYRKALARLVARIVKPHDIEDIVQETYVRIYQASQKQQIYHPKSFMLKTARNLALNHVTRADAMNHLAIAELDSEPDSEMDTSMDESELSEALDMQVQAQEEFLFFCRAIRELPLQCRRTFILRKVYGMSQREVARQLGIGEGTVEKHIAKGMVACSAYMKVHGYAQASEKKSSKDKLRRGNSR